MSTSLMVTIHAPTSDLMILDDWSHDDCNDIVAHAVLGMQFVGHQFGPVRLPFASSAMSDTSVAPFGSGNV